MDDSHLVEAFQRSRDAAAFGTLVERHQGMVFRLILSILGTAHRALAEEVTQDVFLTVYRKLDQFRGDAQFSSWLYRIAYRAAVQHRSRVVFRTPHDSEETLAMTPTDTPGTEPFATAVHERQASAVKDCLDELPDLYRSVLHLHYWMGLTVAEIGLALSAPTGTIKSYLHRARARLQARLAEKGVHDAADL